MILPAPPAFPRYYYSIHVENINTAETRRSMGGYPSTAEFNPLVLSATTQRYPPQSPSENGAVLASSGVSREERCVATFRRRT